MQTATRDDDAISPRRKRIYETSNSRFIDASLLVREFPAFLGEGMRWGWTIGVKAPAIAGAASDDNGIMQTNGSSGRGNIPSTELDSYPLVLTLCDR